MPDTVKLYLWPRRFGKKIMKIHSGDTVQIQLGKDRGKEAKVDMISNKKGKVMISGVNVYKRHVKKMGQMEGGIVDLSKPINVSNVQLVCPNCKKPTRVGYKIENDIKVRVCKKCQKTIDVKGGKNS